MGGKGEMGTQGIGYWRETGLAVSIAAAWIGLALLITKLTGFDGLRVTGYLLIAAGLVLLAWGWCRSPRSNAIAGGFIIALFGALIAFQH